MSAAKSDVLRAFLESGSDLSDPQNREAVHQDGATSPTNLRNRRFIAERGVVFHPVDRCYPARAVSGSCFATALKTASQGDGWAYVEGYALVDRGFMGTEPCGYAIHHAWAIDPNGVLFDPVYLEHGAAYIGVAFNHDYATQRLRHFREAGCGSPLLEDDAFDPSSSAWWHPSMPIRQGPTTEAAARRTWIAENAYFRWLGDGCPHGREVEHWLTAEVEYAARHGAGS